MTGEDLFSALQKYLLQPGFTTRWRYDTRYGSLAVWVALCRAKLHHVIKFDKKHKSAERAAVKSAKWPRSPAVTMPPVLLARCQIE